MINELIDHLHPSSKLLLSPNFICFKWKSENGLKVNASKSFKSLFLNPSPHYAGEPIIFRVHFISF